MNEQMVFLPYPKTVRAKQAEAFFGVKRDTLNKWVAERKVIAYYADRCVFYDFATIEQTIKKLPTEKKGN